jgi:diguanylate cyclase (GGDEF)-like protein/PAS domain S-box-containing protein
MDADSLLNGLLESMEEGLAVQELVFDDQGIPTDYRILTVNDAYTALTGIPRDKAEGQLASVVYKTRPAPCLDRFVDVARTMRPERFELCIPPDERIYRVGVFSPMTGVFVTVFRTDPTERKAYLPVQNEKDAANFQVTLHAIGDAVAMVDLKGWVTLMNDTAEALTGWTLAEASVLPLDEVFVFQNESTGERIENPICNVLDTGRPQKTAEASMLVSRSGRSVAIEGSASPVRSPEGRLTGAVLVLRDVTQENLSRRRIEFLSLHDPLTGLHNRRYYELQLPGLSTPDRMPVAVVMGDVNGLKIANDVFGHSLGDRLLYEVADVLRGCVDKKDVLVRMGGDEFVILLPGVSSAEAEDLCERIRAGCAELRVGVLPVSISLGAAVWEDPERSLEDAIRLAENVMYKSKLIENQAFRSTLLTSIKELLFDRCLETDRHTERLAACCSRIAEAMGLSDKDKTDLEILSMLHDIGKIAVRESIVFKPTALDEAEWLEMKRHTEVGYRIAQATPELFHIAEAILSHHERWDGGGYPQGTVGMNIPRLARILTVADSFDAMTNFRPFRDAIGIDEAAEEIRKGAGHQFDPYIADIFLKKVLSPASEDQE